MKDYDKQLTINRKLLSSIGGKRYEYYIKNYKTAMDIFVTNKRKGFIK